MTRRELELESALVDAALMARVTVEFVGRVLGIDEAHGAPLDPEHRSQLSFVLLETCLKIEKAKNVFYGEPT